MLHSNHLRHGNSKKRGGKGAGMLSSSGEGQGAQGSMGTIVAGASLGLLVAAAALFAKMKRSKAQQSEEGPTEAEYATIPLLI